MPTHVRSYVGSSETPTEIYAQQYIHVQLNVDMVEY